MRQWNRETTTLPRHGATWTYRLGLLLLQGQKKKEYRKTLEKIMEEAGHIRSVVIYTQTMAKVGRKQNIYDQESVLRSIQALDVAKSLMRQTDEEPTPQLPRRRRRVRGRQEAEPTAEQTAEQTPEQTFSSASSDESSDESTDSSADMEETLGEECQDLSASLRDDAAQMFLEREVEDNPKAGEDAGEEHGEVVHDAEAPDIHIETIEDVDIHVQSGKADIQAVHQQHRDELQLAPKAHPHWCVESRFDEARTFSGRLSLGPDWHRLESYISEVSEHPLEESFLKWS